MASPFTNIIKNAPNYIPGQPGSYQPGAPNDPNGVNVPSMIQALYKQYGVQDAGRGSGFTDAAYWAEHPSEVLNGRLGRDLAGTGTDQPTGTVWGPKGPPTFTNLGAPPPSPLPTGMSTQTPSSMTQALNPSQDPMATVNQTLQQYQDSLRQQLMQQLQPSSQQQV